MAGLSTPKAVAEPCALHGINGEEVMLNNAFMGIDPNSPGYRNMQQMHDEAPLGRLIYPANADLVQAFPDLIQQFRRTNGLPPANLQD